MKKLLCMLVALGLAPAAVAQSMEWVKNATYHIKYQVPAHWTQLKEGNDTITLVTHVSPEQDMMLLVGKLKGAAEHITTEQALEGLLRNFGVSGNRMIPTRYNGIRFLETTGAGVLTHPATLATLPVQYDAMAATHRGHVILVYVYATREAYTLHRSLIDSVVHSITPYRGK